jgi:serine phosphatase RsbU (regulator of sigma subunit)
VIGAWANGSAPEITQAVQQAVLAHVGDARVGDDLTVLVLRRA